MTEQGFRSQIARLKSVFGDKAFLEAKCELIQRACRTLQDEAFERICTHFVASFRYAPLPKDFLEAAAKERAATQNYGDKASIPEKIECHWCNDGGVMEVEHAASKKEYFVRCICEAGEKSVWGQIPIWSKSMEQELKPLKMFGDRALKWKPRKYNPLDPENSLRELVDLWKLKVNLSQVFFDSWGNK